MSRGYLLDTHAFLWMAGDESLLGSEVRRVASHPESELFLSVASAWEMAIKQSLGKLDLEVELSKLISQQLPVLRVRRLPVTWQHAVEVAELQFHHRDPFDRMLVTQAHCEDLAILSADASFDAYDVERIWD